MPVLYTFGNASGIARDQNLVVIKLSGVPYEEMKPAHLVVTDLEGKIVEGNFGRFSLRGHKMAASSGKVFRVDNVSHDYGACDP